MTILLFSPKSESLGASLGGMAVGASFKTVRPNTAFLSVEFDVSAYDFDIVFYDNRGEKLSGIMKIVPTSGALSNIASVVISSVPRSSPGSFIVSGIRLTVSCSDGGFSGKSDKEGQQAVDEKWISARSYGVLGDERMVDDAQVGFKRIGGGFENEEDYLELGDIFPGSSRIVHFGVSVPFGVEPPPIIYPRILMRYSSKHV